MNTMQDFRHFRMLLTSILYRLFLFLAGASAFWIWYMRDQVEALPRFAFGLTGVAIFSGLAHLFRRSFHRLGRLHDKALANSILDGLETKEGGQDFVLYLRSFELDPEGRLLSRNPYKSESIMSPGYFEPNLVNLESNLAQALSSVGLLIGLGNAEDEEQVLKKERGAGLILVNPSSWTKKFEMLAEGARVIVMIPWDSPGCLEEVERLRGSHWAKAIILIPSEMTESHEQRNGIYESCLSADRWQAIRTSFSDRGVYLPESVSKGMALTLDEDGKPKTVCQPFSLADPSDANRTLCKLFPPPVLKQVRSRQRRRILGRLGFAGCIVAIAAMLLYWPADSGRNRQSRESGKGQSDIEIIYLRTLRKFNVPMPDDFSDKVLLGFGQNICSDLALLPAEETKAKMKDRLINRGLSEDRAIELTEVFTQVGVTAFCPKLASMITPSRTEVEKEEEYLMGLSLTVTDPKYQVLPNQYLSRDELLSLGRETCIQLGDGKSFTAIMAGLEKRIAILEGTVSPGIPEKDLAGSIFGVSIQAFCPNEATNVIRELN